MYDVWCFKNVHILKVVYSSLLVAFFLDIYDRFLMDDMPLSSLGKNYSYVLILSILKLLK